MAEYSITIKPSAVKELGFIPKKISQLIVKRIQRLGTDPRPPGSQKLSAQERYRIRQGDYRVIYGIDDSTKVVDIVKISHRRDVYR